MLTTRKVAARLSVSESWVRLHAVSLGGVRVGKMWRFPTDCLDRFLGTGTLPACPPTDPATSTSTNAQKAQENGASDTATMMAPSGKNAATSRRMRRQLARLKYDSTSTRVHDYYGLSQSWETPGEPGTSHL